MNEMKAIKVLFFILTMLTTGSVILLAVHIIMTMTRPYNNAPVTLPLTKQQIVLECEKISATATNEGWSYTKCLENLNKAGTGIKTLEAI